MHSRMQLWYLHWQEDLSAVAVFLMFSHSGILLLDS